MIKITGTEYFKLIDIILLENLTEKIGLCVVKLNSEYFLSSLSYSSPSEIGERLF